MMKRSQIYLPMEQWRRLGALSHQTRRSVSELIRRAIDRVYRPEEAVDFEKALADIRGAWASRDDLPPTPDYVRRLRGGSRLNRI